MNPLVLAGLLAALVVVPLILIAIFYVIGRVFRAPRRFASILFLILFVVVLAGASFVYLRAGTQSAATVTSASERVIADDALRTRHEFTLGADVPGAGARTLSVPARIYDATAVGDHLEVRAGSLLGLKLTRAQDERITDQIGIVSLVCAVLVVLFVALACASRTARLPAILLMFAALIGIGVQPAISGLNPRGASSTATATVTSVLPVGPASLSGTPAGYLRGPFSIDQRWMWANDKDIEFMAVTFVPDGRTTAITATDVVPAQNAPAQNTQLQIRYLNSDPRRITTDFSQATACALILLGLLGVAELLLISIAAIAWRLRVRRRRREAEAEARRVPQADRDLAEALQASTRRDPRARLADGPYDDETRQQF